MVLLSGLVKKKARHSLVFWMCVASTVGMFLVNTLGFVDTDTGSALGCGHDWPFCNGAVIPQRWGIHTLIEFSHRGLVGVVSILLFVAAIWAWRKYSEWTEVRVTAAIAMGGVIAEAVLGALTVLFTNPPAVIATHLGVAISAFTATFLMTIVVGQIENQLRVHDTTFKRRPERPVVELRSTPVSQGLRRLIWWSVPYTLLAMYYGAYIASTGDGGMFQGWPFPTESYQAVHGVLWLDILHRTIALSLLILAIVLVRLTSRIRGVRPDIFRGAVISLILVCTQAITGGILILSHLALNAFLLHVSNVTFLFVTMAYLGMQTLPEPVRRSSEVDSPSGGRGGIALHPRVARR